MNFHLKFITRAAIIRLAVLAAVIVILLVLAYFKMIKMPGKTYSGPLPPLTADQLTLRDQLIEDVDTLASKIGERNIWQHKNLTAAADFLESSLTRSGYTVNRQTYTVEEKPCSNLEVQITGSKSPEQIVIVGAHYDTVFGCPGANDNASAVAANLRLAKYFADSQPDRTLRFLFFVNEEPPFFQTENMGSTVYAKRCKEKGENIIAMLSLETLGFYTDKPNSQSYPPPFSLFYPSTGNFLAFVSNPASKELLKSAISSFRNNCPFPSDGGAIPEIFPGINWSDHYSFWRQKYPAIMITDTAPFRYPHYHSPDDTPDKLDYDSLARITTGIKSVINDLTKSSP